MVDLVSGLLPVVLVAIGHCVGSQDWALFAGSMLSSPSTGIHRWN